jgi:hypothetical protein
MNTIPRPKFYHDLAEDFLRKATEATRCANVWRRETTAMMKRYRYWKQKQAEARKQP